MAVSPPKLTWGQKTWLSIIQVTSRVFVMRPLITIFSAIGLNWFNAKMRAFPREAANMADRIAAIYFKASNPWVMFANSYMKQLTGKEFPASTLDKMMDKGSSETASAMSQALGQEYLAPMLNMIMPRTVDFDQIRKARGGEFELEHSGDRILDPVDGLIGAERFLGVNLQFQLQAWMLHFIGDTVSMGSMKSLKDLPNAISWSYGVGWLSWLVMGTPFQLTIADPLRKLLNMLYRPTELTVAQVIDAFNSGYVTWDYLRRVMREAGYQDEIIPVLVNQGTTRMPTGVMHDAYLANRMRWDTVAGELQRMGYNQEKIQYYIGGEIDGNGKLVAGNRTSDDRTPGIWELERHDKLLESWAKECVDSYESGFLTFDEFYTSLKAAGWEDVELTRPVSGSIRKMFDRYGLSNVDRVGPIALQALISLQKREKKSQLTKTEIRDMWTQGITTDESTDIYLRRLGMTDTNIALLKDLWGAGLIERDVMNLYKKKIIDPSKAVAYLNKLGIQQPDAILLIKLWDNQLAAAGEARASRLTKYDIRMLLAAGKLSVPDSVQGLVNLGYSLDIARDIVNIWRGVTQTEIDKLQARIDALEAPGPPTLTRSEVKQLFDKGLMTLEKVYKYLKDAGYLEKDALLLTQLYTGVSADMIKSLPSYTSPGAAPRALTVTEIKMLYEAGAPGFDTSGALTRMKGIGYSEADATLLIALWLPWSPPEAGA